MRWVIGIAALGVAAVVVAGACNDDETTMDAPGGSGGTASSSSSTSTTSGWTTSTTNCPNWPECEEQCDSLPVPEEGACRDCADLNCLGGNPCQISLSLCCEVFTYCELHDWDCFDIAEWNLAEQNAAISVENTMRCLEDHCGDVCDGVNTCGTDLGQLGFVVDSCLTSKCCTEYVPCYDDSGCNGCLQDPELAGCDTNALWATYDTCAQSQCPIVVCGAGIGYWLGPLPLFACNKCVATDCCAPLVACVGGVVPDPPQAAVDLCVECLTDSGSVGCTDQVIADAADDFNYCVTAHCGELCD